jgi:tetratricopeptide (TPR) repeat protein
VSSYARAASTILLGAAFAGIAFGAAGGTELARTTAVELILVVLGAAVVAAALLWCPDGPVRGGVTLAALAALTALTALSITWSIAPDLSYEDAGRMLAYLAVFAAAIAGARMAPRSAPVLLHALLLAAVAVVVYGLASRVWPGALAENELSNRLGQPYGYWNAVGTTAAMIVPAALWLGSRGAGTVAARVLAYPAMGLALLTILLTQSRGALAAALIGGILWFALVPLRLRSLPALVAPGLIMAPVAAWALSQDAFSTYAEPLASRESAGGEFGLLLLAMIAVLFVAGFAVNLGLSRVTPTVDMKRRAGIAAVAVACAVPLALFTSVAFSDRGIGGTISDRVDELTSETTDAPSEGAGRLAATSNSRSTFWREAGDVYEDRKAAGTGAGTFGVARLRYRKGEQVSRHAHGFVPQTLADLGLVGVALSLLLLGAWLVAVARATQLYPRRLRRGKPPERRDWTPDRMALVTLLLVALVFGLQSLIDWTWFVPGPAVMALVAGGFVAGRTPMPAAPAVTLPPPAPGRPRVALAAGMGVVALLFAWAIWQPEASNRASNQALDLIEQGKPDDAAAKTGDAEDANPLSPEPLLVRASAQTAAGRERDAEATLERAVLRFPSYPDTWLRLASFQFGTVDQPEEAAETVLGVLYLDPHSKAGRQLYLEIQQRLRADERKRARRR